jgi:cytochrome c553
MKKLTVIAVLVLAISTAWAKDAASIYKSKCAGCHGAQGEGKSGPKLAGTSRSEDDIVKALTTGGLSKPHTPSRSRAQTLRTPSKLQRM